MHYRVLILALLMSVPCLLSGCIYRLTIQQGNLISDQACAQLKVGMSKAQVVALLGKPVLDNAFEENRWYYVYTQQKGNERMIKKGIVLCFVGDRLQQIIRE